MLARRGQLECCITPAAVLVIPGTAIARVLKRGRPDPVPLSDVPDAGDLLASGQGVTLCHASVLPPAWQHCDLSCGALKAVQISADPQAVSLYINMVMHAGQQLSPPASSHTGSEMPQAAQLLLRAAQSGIASVTLSMAADHPHLMPIPVLQPVEQVLSTATEQWDPLSSTLKTFMSGLTTFQGTSKTDSLLEAALHRFEPLHPATAAAPDCVVSAPTHSDAIVMLQKLIEPAVSHSNSALEALSQTKPDVTLAMPEPVLLELMDVIQPGRAERGANNGWLALDCSSDGSAAQLGPCSLALDEHSCAAAVQEMCSMPPLVKAGSKQVHVSLVVKESKAHVQFRCGDDGDTVKAAGAYLHGLLRAHAS
jgi:hypothetical protein